MKQVRFTLFAVSVAAFIIWAMFYQAGVLSAGEKVAPGEKEAKAVPAFQWQPLAGQKQKLSFKAVGTVRSREEIDVFSRLPYARVTEVPFLSGERFNEGDMLIKIEDRDLKAKSSAAAENLKGAESHLEFAQAEYDRNLKLLEANAVSRREFEAASTTLSAAKSQVAMLKNELQYAQINLEYASIIAPFAGVVAERSCEPGDLATPQNPLLKIFNPAKLQFQVPVREGLYTAVKIADQLQATVASTGKTYSAVVREIVPSVDPGSRSFLINAQLQDNDQNTGLMPGMFAECEIPTGNRTILVVPKSAVQRVGQLEFLRIKAADGRAIRQLVKTAPLNDNEVEIVSGAKEGDEYTVDWD